MQRRPFKDGQENKHKESLFERKEAREFPSAIDNNMIEDPKKKTHAPQEEKECVYYRTISTTEINSSKA